MPIGPAWLAEVGRDLARHGEAVYLLAPRMVRRAPTALKQALGDEAGGAVARLIALPEGHNSPGWAG